MEILYELEKSIIILEVQDNQNDIILNRECVSGGCPPLDLVFINIIFIRKIILILIRFSLLSLQIASIYLEKLVNIL